MVTLYTTHCPKCNVLEKKLDKKKIEYTLVDDFDIQAMVDKGIMSAPILEVDEKLMTFTEANKWVTEQ